MKEQKLRNAGMAAKLIRAMDEVKELSQIDDHQRVVIADLRCEIATFNELSPVALFQLGVIKKYSNFTLMGLAQEADDFGRHVEDVINETYIDLCYANPLAAEYVDIISNPDCDEDPGLIDEPWFGEGCRD